MLLNLDLPSLLITSATFNAVMIAVLLYIRTFQKTYPGFSYWVLGVASNVIGQLSLAHFQGNAESLPAALGSTLVIGMPMFCWFGLRLFMGLEANLKQFLAILLVSISVVLTSTLIMDTQQLRQVLVSAIALTFCILALKDTRQHLHKVINGGSGLLQFALIITSLLLLLRMFAISAQMSQSGAVEPPTVSQTELAVLVLTSVRLIFVFSLIMLNQQRIELELHQAKNQLADNSKQFVDQLRRLNVDLNKTSRTDALTGLANRRYFDETLATELQRHQRTKSPLCLLMFDVDHFKLFNDTYGHTAGDDCLAALGGEIAAAASRPTDFAARYGGEEFALILPETDSSGARNIATSLMDKVAQLNYPFDASPTANAVTLSIGIASLTPTRDHTPSDLIDSADSALYEAKRNGRNQICETTQAV